ncbi:MAG: hypothetical protein WC536_02035 [Patescibacteria group bacterium]
MKKTKITQNNYFLKKFRSFVKTFSFLSAITFSKVFALETGVTVNGQTQFAGYKSYMSAVLVYAIKLGFALASLMIIYAGIKYVTSKGNETQISEAKEIALGAILGFIMLLLIDAILNFLGVK